MGGVRSPLTIQWKGVIEPGTRVEKIAAAIDLLPTLTDLAGIDLTVSKTLDGSSLKPLLLGSDETWEDRFLINHWRKSTSVRSQQFRLDNKNQLFDMESDPAQEIDLPGHKITANCL